MAAYCLVVFLLCGCFAVANSFTGAKETFNVKPNGKLSHAEVKLVMTGASSNLHSDLAACHPAVALIIFRLQLYLCE